MIKPLVTLTVLACALSAFAQTQLIKIKSKGDDIRTVIDTIFEQSGKQYVLETNFHQSLYMSLDGVTFDKAVGIISKVADLDFEEKQGIWYVRKKAPAMRTTVVKPTTKPIEAEAKPAAKITTKTPVKPTTKETAKISTLPKTEDTAAQGFSKATDLKPITVDLTNRLTVQLKKMEIRDVFSEFGRQAKVEIEIDETVPNYKLDAFFYNTSLKFALDKVCKVAGLKYTFTPSKTVRISKA
jgi:hypothetical protein